MSLYAYACVYDKLMLMRCNTGMRPFYVAADVHVSVCICVTLKRPDSHQLLYRSETECVCTYACLNSHADFVCLYRTDAQELLHRHRTEFACVCESFAYFHVYEDLTLLSFYTGMRQNPNEHAHVLHTIVSLRT